MESTRRVKAMLVSGSRLFREGMKHLLSGSPYQIEAEAANAQEALERLQASGVQLILVDLIAVRKDLVEGIGALRNAVPNARLIVLSDDACILKLAQLPRSLIDGYLLKDTSPEALIQLLNLAMLGERVLPTALVQMIIEGRFELDGLAASAGAAGLSEREIEILRYLIDGTSNKIIANRLEIAESTVKVHMKTILRKIRMKNRTQAAIWAVEHGIEGNLSFAESKSNGQAAPPRPTERAQTNKGRARVTAPAAARA